MVNFSVYNDHDLSLLIASGDVAAFKYIFQKHRNKVYSIALGFAETGAAAEDMVQEVFMKLWINKAKLAGVENFEAYLNTVTRNHLLNYLRKLANDHLLYQKLFNQYTGQTEELSDNIVYHELENMVRKAVNQLPPQQKRVYNFCRVEGLKHEEIAEKMGIARSTVKGHMVEALSNIRNYLLANGQLAPALFIVTLFI